jgi:hypothetical protein
MKPVDLRIAECVSIRQQLQECGVLQYPHLAAKLTQHMNAFIKTGEPQSFRLVSYEIVLTANDKKQSGIYALQ